MTPLPVGIKRLPNAADLPLPGYASSGAAGMDLFAAVESEVVIPPGGTVTVPTGIAVALPEGYEAQVRPRSGLAGRNAVGVINSPGTVDSDYRGEIRVILTNFGAEPFIIRRGDRIAQMVVARYESVNWMEMEELPPTVRGEGGFGHTGV